MKPKTARRRHQEFLFQHIKDVSAYMINWDMGIGKTKLAIDLFVHKVSTGQVNALLVIAPNGVPDNWAYDEFPKHMPDELVSQLDVLLYESSKAKNKRETARRKEFLNTGDGKVKVLMLCYQAVLTKAAHDLITKFLARFRVMAVLDESQRIKGTGAIPQRIISYGGNATQRFTLTGTPLTNTPFDAYSQVEFISPGLWAKHGLHPRSIFKAYFGQYRKAYTRDDRQLNIPIGYKHLDELKGILKTISHRLTMHSAGVQLPPKEYVKKYFHLTPKQRSVYKEFQENNRVVLPETGDLLLTEYDMVVLIRLQQICCNFVSVEQGEPYQRIDSGSSPRLDLLMQTIDELGDVQQVIWSKYTKDIDDICNYLGNRCVRYDGSVGREDRQRAKHAFRDGKAQFFVGSPGAGGTGLDGLQVAQVTHYYSTSYLWEHRMQSEARTHRIGQKNSHLYIDYLGVNTIESRIIDNLRRKTHTLNVEVLGDEKKEWI